MKTRVELVYDLDCPNVTAARAALLQAFAQAGLPASWTEWNRKSPDSPESVRAYGSPTILVDGVDVAAAEPGAGADYCRVYVDGENRFRGVPPVEGIVAALMKIRDLSEVDELRADFNRDRGVPRIILLLSPT